MQIRVVSFGFPRTNLKRNLNLNLGQRAIGMDVYLIFQLDNPMEENRFGHYLTRNGWQRLTTGVYHAATRDLDEEKLWSKARGEFSFDPERDFFAIFKSESAFIPTKKYYTKKAPAWPKELSVADD